MGKTHGVNNAASPANNAIKKNINGFNSIKFRIPARLVKINDTIDTIYGPAEVNNIVRKKCQGIVSPITYSGNIVVNGVKASCLIEKVNYCGAMIVLRLCYYILFFLGSYFHRKNKNGIPIWVSIIAYITCHTRFLPKIKKN